MAFRRQIAAISLAAYLCALAGASLHHHEHEHGESHHDRQHHLCDHGDDHDCEELASAAASRASQSVEETRGERAARGEQDTDDDDCVLCQFLARPWLTVAPVDGAPLAGAVEVISLCAAPAPSGDRLDLPHSRGPPRLALE